MNSKIILTFFISFIMITSVIGFLYSSDSVDNSFETLEYNNYEFKNINGKYLLEIDNNEYVFDNSPYDLNGIISEDFNLESDKYYILFNPSERNSNLEYSIQKLYLVLRSLGVNVQLACSIEEGCDETLPIKDCSNNAIFLKKEGEPKIYKEDNCIIVQGSSYKNIDEGVDKINLKLLGI